MKIIPCEHRATKVRAASAIHDLNEATEKLLQLFASERDPAVRKLIALQLLKVHQQEAIANVPNLPYSVLHDLERALQWQLKL